MENGSTTVTERVTKVLKDFAPTWSGDLDEWDDSALSSLEYLDLLFTLEEEFGVEIDLDLNDVKSPRDLIAEIEAQGEK